MPAKVMLILMVGYLPKRGVEQLNGNIRMIGRYGQVETEDNILF